MHKNTNNNQRRNQKLRARKAAKLQRRSSDRTGDLKSVKTPPFTKPYDVRMVGDFLEQLLLELRIQYYENLKLLNSLDSNDDLQTAMKVTEEISPDLVNKLKKFMGRSQSILITSTVIDGTDASEEEAKAIMHSNLKIETAKRDEQIGHLEALKDLFDEALRCARTPCGIDQHGVMIQPETAHNVRKLTDNERLASIPAYDALLPMFSGHFLANSVGIQRLKDISRSSVIVASNKAYDEPLDLYIPKTLKRDPDNGVASAMALDVANFQELQFVLAAIVKFVGVPVTDGKPWKDL